MPVYMPEACLAQQNAPEKALAFLRDVVGLDVAAYRARLDSHTQDLFRDTLPQESMKYTLESDGSKLEVFFNFVNGKLQKMSIYLKEGVPHMVQKAANEVEIAKGFLSRYQAYYGAKHVEAFRTILNTVEANRNITKVAENIKFEAEYIKTFVEWENCTIDSARFAWIYTFNGAQASDKWVAISFENGFLTGFIDNWDLFKIGSYDIKVDEGKAIEIAMNAVKNYAYKVYMGRDAKGEEIWIEVKDFKVVKAKATALMFANGIFKAEARGGDPLTLYPTWTIDLYFDTLYPGNVYGVYIRIWADTGEIRQIVPMMTSLEHLSHFNGGSADGEGSAEQELGESHNGLNNWTGPNLTQIAWIGLSISIGIALAALKIYSKKRKGEPARSAMPKLNSLKIAIAFCLLISLTTFPTAMPMVNADSRGVVFYGSRWCMTQAEQDAARAVINHMKYNFYYRNYVCYDFYGSQTQKQTVLHYASAMEETFDYVAVFYHGHGGLKPNTNHRDFFDDDGPDHIDHQIWDYEIWPKTRRNKHFFVMLWACRQGDLEGGRYGPLGAYGMPFSWLDPISRGDCFIGFERASMPLTQKSIHNQERQYRDFVCYFDYYALYQGLSVIGALNEASKDLFYGRTFYNTELYTGFTAKWPFPLISNGGFETGDASYWTVGGPGDHSVTGEDPYSGSYSMLLGFKYQPNALDTRDYAYQLITIPKNATDVKFSFRYHLFTEDSLSCDLFEVYVAPEGGSPSLVFQKGGSTRGGLEEYGWAEVTIDLSHYADPYDPRRIYIYFSVVNRVDIRYKTWCYIDDVFVKYLAEGNGLMKIYGNKNINLLTPPSNSQPNSPTIPLGPTSGYTGVSYTYSTSTTDPDGDSVRYQFDWGDGSTTTTDWHPSGTQVSASHSWSSPGTYYVRVRAQDSLNAWGGWSYPRIVNIAPSHLLTVLAYDFYGYLVYADVYIDGQWVGYTGSTFSLAPGTHELYVSNWAYNEWGVPCYFYCYDIGANNPIIISISSDMTITAWYCPYY